MAGRDPTPYPSGGGFTIIELTLALVIGMALVVPLLGAGAEARSRALVRHAAESAAALLARGRWAAVTGGGATVEFVAEPPVGHLISQSGDTVLSRRLGRGGVELELSRGRSRARVSYGPMGLGIVSSQTLRFRHGSAEEALIVSSLGRVRRDG